MGLGEVREQGEEKYIFSCPPYPPADTEPCRDLAWLSSSSPKAGRSMRKTDALGCFLVLQSLGKAMVKSSSFLQQSTSVFLVVSTMDIKYSLLNIFSYT